MSVVRFSIDWSNDALNAAPEERATVADLQIYISDQNVTMHLIDDENENHLTLPLYSLAEGLAHDWWNLFGNRDQEISLIKYRMGYAVPDVRFSFDGAAFEISAHQFSYRNPNVRFWAGPSDVLGRSDAEQLLGGFIEEILQKLSQSDLRETSAALRWARIQESRASDDEVAFCEAAGALGVDPYQVDSEASAIIESAAELFSGEALNEFLAGARGNPAGPLFRWIRQVEGWPRLKSLVGNLSGAAAAAAEKSPHKANERSWELGYRRARALRSVLGLGLADRLRTYKSIAEKLGASKQYKLAPRVDGIRALRSDQENGVHIYLRNHGNSPDAKAGETFAFARAVGDAVCFPAISRSPVNELHDAFRQAAGRAFAAEFLAPIDEIQSMRRDGKDVLSIADEFSTATELINRQLENHQRIAEACL
jgi:hypothetical protein